MTNGIPIGTKKAPALWPSYVFLLLVAIVASALSFQIGKVAGRDESLVPICETDAKVASLMTAAYMLEIAAYDARMRIEVMQVQVATLYNVISKCVPFLNLGVVKAPPLLPEVEPAD